MIYQYINQVQILKALNKVQRFMTKLHAVFFLVCIVISSPAWALEAFGNSTGANRMLLQPAWDTPQVLAQGKIRANLDLDYSNTFCNKKSQNWAITEDMEYARAGLSLFVGFFKKSELSLKISFLSFHSGFMDNGLKAYHDALGVGNYGRDARPDNNFAYQITSFGKNWFPGKDQGMGFGDMLLGVKKHIWSGSTWRISAKTTVKLPTGDPDQGFGSGGFDAQAIALAGWQPHDKWALSFGAGHTWLARPDVLSGIDADFSGTTFFGLGLTYFWTDKFSVFVQAGTATPAFENTGINALDDAYGDVTFGVRHTWKNKWSAYWALSEDLSRAAADFTMHTGVGFDF